MSPHSDNVCRPVQAEAYNLAMAEIRREHSELVVDERIVDVVMDAVIDLANAGQTDAQALSRYAVSRALAAHRAVNHLVG